MYEWWPATTDWEIESKLVMIFMPKINWGISTNIPSGVVQLTGEKIAIGIFLKVAHFQYCDVF